MGCPTIADHALSRDLDGETVVLNVDSGKYYSLRRVGVFIWGLLEQGHDVDAIIEQVRVTFEIPVETARADVLELLEDLEDHGLIVGNP